MRVDISIDSDPAGSVTTTAPTASAASADAHAADAGAAEAGPYPVAGAGALDAGPPSSSLVAEVTAGGGDGALQGSNGLTSAASNGRRADAVDAGGAPG